MTVDQAVKGELADMGRRQAADSDAVPCHERLGQREPEGKRMRRSRGRWSTGSRGVAQNRTATMALTTTQELRPPNLHAHGQRVDPDVGRRAPASTARCLTSSGSRR